MERVKAQSIHQDDEISIRETLALVCYHYPQYTLEEANKLSVRDINLLIFVAEKQYARKMYDLTQISAAPHTEKGKAVKSLLKHFKSQTERK